LGLAKMLATSAFSEGSALFAKTRDVWVYPVEISTEKRGFLGFAAPLEGETSAGFGFGYEFERSRRDPLAMCRSEAACGLGGSQEGGSANRPSPQSPKGILGSSSPSAFRCANRQPAANLVL
jgi:hypothetical protein